MSHPLATVHDVAEKRSQVHGSDDDAARTRPGAPAPSAGEGGVVSPGVFTVLFLAGAIGFLVPLFVAAHVAWLDKQRRRALRHAPGAAGERPAGEPVRRSQPEVA